MLDDRDLAHYRLLISSGEADFDPDALDGLALHPLRRHVAGFPPERPFDLVPRARPADPATAAAFREQEPAREQAFFLLPGRLSPQSEEILMLDFFEGRHPGHGSWKAFRAAIEP